MLHDHTHHSFQHLLLFKFSIISLLPLFHAFSLSPSLSLSYTHVTTHARTFTQAHKVGRGWDYLGLRLPEVGGAKVCPAAYWWIFLQLGSLMFKEVVQIKTTCTII